MRPKEKEELFEEESLPPAITENDAKKLAKIEKNSGPALFPRKSAEEAGPSLSKDTLGLILGHFTLRDWASVSQVSRFWLKCAQQNSVINAVTQNSLFDFVEKHREDIENLRGFLSPEELISFLEDLTIPISVKVMVFQYLMMRYEGEGFPILKTFFPISFETKVLRDASKKSLAPLIKIFESFSKILIELFRFQRSGSPEAYFAKFSQEVENYYSQNEIPDPKIALSENLQSFLVSEKSRELMRAQKDLNVLLSSLKKQYLEAFSFATNGLLTNKTVVIAFLILGIISLPMSGFGMYFLVRAVLDLNKISNATDTNFTWFNSTNVKEFDHDLLFAFPLFLPGVLGLAAAVIFLSCWYNSYQNQRVNAANRLEENANQHSQASKKEANEKAPSQAPKKEANEETPFLGVRVESAPTDDFGSAVEFKEGLFDDARSDYGLN